MGFLEGRESDVFISYASLDDEPFSDAPEGWVSMLHRDLEKRVNQMLGHHAKIWRDDTDLQGNDQLSPTVERILKNTGALLSIVSPGFMESKWCKREVEVFCCRDGGKLNLPQQNKYRILKVIKIPVPRPQQFPEIQESLFYEFFQNAKGGHTIELAPSTDALRTQRYVEALYRLADQIARLLKLIKANVPAAPPRATVYLAETTSDLRETRTKLRDDLIQRNFEVLPDQELDRDSGEYRSQVNSYLQRSILSVHLIGEKYGAVPEGERESHVAVQAELAADRCSEKSFRRVIWMPVDLTPVEDAQKNFVNFLHNDEHGQARTELVQKRIEDLKEDLQAWLNEALNVSAPGESPAENSRRVYVISEPQDIESGVADSLLNSIEDYGLEVSLSPKSNDPAEILLAHRENLQRCSACLIYYGTASDAWAQIKCHELEKSFGKNPYPCRAIYISGPETPYKKRFRPEGIQIIREPQSFSPAALQPFFEVLRKASRPA
jgi:hypothetical protein